MIRNRKPSNNVIEKVKLLDAFPKLKDEYVQKQKFGGFGKLLQIWCRFLSQSLVLDYVFSFHNFPALNNLHNIPGSEILHGQEAHIPLHA